MKDFIIKEEEGVTLLTGAIESQTKLYTLLSVSSLEPDLEEVFLKLVKNKREIDNHGNIKNYEKYKGLLIAWNTSRKGYY